MAGVISSLGVGSGLNLANMLEQLRENENKSLINPLENKKTNINEKLAAFNSISKSILDIRSDALKLGLQSTYLGRSVKVGNSSVIDAKVVDGTITGNHQANVTRIATKSSWTSQNGVANANSIATLSGGTFSFKVGGVDQVNVTVSANATLKEIADSINSKNAGVTATIINTGNGANPYKLALTANNTGESSRITIINQLGDFQLIENQGAGGSSLNAELTVDGITYQRSSNTGISDILGGVTLNLNGTGVSSLDVIENKSSLKDAIKGFVEKFNTLANELKEKTGYDNKGKAGLLSDVSSIKTLRFDLSNLMNTIINVNGSIKSMVDLGASVNRDGTITIDESALDAVLENKYDDVKNFFTGNDKIKGFADTVADKMNSLTRFGTGVLAIEETTAQNTIKKLDLQIESTKARLDKKFLTLEKQFQQLDSFMSSMKSLGTYLTNQFNALSAMASSSNKK